MNHKKKMIGILAAAVLASFVLTFTLSAQAPAAQPGRAAAGRGPAGPQVVSPEVLPDRRVTFRILAPQAQNVRVSGGDMPALAGAGRGATAPSGPPPGQMTKAENGVWSVTVGPVDPGAYRYNFNVDGVTVIDPRNPSVSESNNNVWSLVYRARLGLHGHEAGAARRGGQRDVLFDGAEAVPAHARLHAAGLRVGQGQVPGLLPAARRGRLRRLLEQRRPRRLHPRQPDRRQEGQADDRRDARRAHQRRGLWRRRPARRGHRRSTSSRRIS